MKKNYVNTRNRFSEMRNSDSKSSPKSSKAPKPNFMEPTTVNSSPIGPFFAQSGNPAPLDAQPTASKH